MNDQLFKKRKAASQNDFKRKPAFKNLRARILIICEDAVSAPDYFKKLKKSLCPRTAKVIIKGKECGSDPIDIYKYGEYYLAKKDDGFNHVFFVFDKDSHISYPDALDAILKLARKYKEDIENIKAITSVPCFEIWLMLHVKYSDKSYQKAKELIKELKKYPAFKNYEKSNAGYFDAIKDKTDTAIENSKKLCKDSEDVAHPNPSTLIHEIAIIFKELQDENR